MNPRASAVYGVLCRPGEKLCVLVWDSWPVLIEKPTNHQPQKASWSTKVYENAFSRLEACDLEGRPIFMLCLAASLSPRATDESLCAHLLEIEAVSGIEGGLSTMLDGAPGFCVVLLFDNGFW